MTELFSTAKADESTTSELFLDSFQTALQARANHEKMELSDKDKVYIDMMVQNLSFALDAIKYDDLDVDKQALVIDKLARTYTSVFMEAALDNVT